MATWARTEGNHGLVNLDLVERIVCNLDGANSQVYVVTARGEHIVLFKTDSDAKAAQSYYSQVLAQLKPMELL
jgi:sulfur transfer protein SufE